MQRKVLVAGAQGVIGRAAATRLAARPDTQVLGLSRRTEPSIPNVEAVSVDLLDPGQVRDRLGGIRDVTHIVFGAYIEKQTAAEKSTVNVAILRNLLDVVEETAPGLRHVTFYQGGKAYGADLGPFKTPAREDDPRLMPPNFYYDQENLLRERQKGKDWSFTALRPEAVCGFAVGNPMNLLTVIAVYAAISKELGIPLRFPGLRPPTERSTRSAPPTSWPRPPTGPVRRRLRETRSSTSPTATTFAGSTCGRGSRACSTWTGPIRSRCRSRPTWPTRGRSGIE